MFRLSQDLFATSCFTSFLQLVHSLPPLIHTSTNFFLSTHLSAMSPSPSPSPPPQELTEEELELLEMAERMRTPEPEEELPLPQNILPGLDNGVMNGNSTSPESAPCPRSNELVSARRFAARHKLHPYQREAVEEFVKVLLSATVFTLKLIYQSQDTIVGQQIKLFIKQCELGNKLDGLLMVAPPFSVSKPLMVR